jgi:hypothetical protein
MFRGMVLGILMMVGGVYVADSQADGGTRPIVNWDVAIVRSVEAASFVREHMARLIDQARGVPSAPAETSN